MPKRGSLPWQQDPAILQRLALVEEYHLLGHTNYQVADILTERGTTCSEPTVRRDLERIRSLWRERIGDSVQKHRDRAVISYRRVQRAAWQEFETTKSTSLNKSAYLNTVKSAEDSIAKVLDAYPAEKHDVDVNGVSPLLIRLVDGRDGNSDAGAGHV